MTYTAIAGYVLDLTVGLSGITFFTMSIAFISILLIFRRNVFLYSLSHFKIISKKRELRADYIFSFGAVVFTFILLASPSILSPFIYPSDSIYYLWYGRLLSWKGHIALLLSDYSPAAMAQPLGFIHFLATLFSLDITQSYNFFFLTRPFFGLLAILSVYELTKRLTFSEIASGFAVLIWGTTEELVWAQAMNVVPYTTVGYVVPVVFLLLYDFLVEQDQKIGFILSIVAGGLVLYHPHRALEVIVPMSLWYLMEGRKRIPLKEVAGLIVVFVATSSFYFMLMRPRTFLYRLEHVGNLARGSLLKVTFRDPLAPFFAEQGLISLFFVLGSIFFLLKKSEPASPEEKTHDAGHDWVTQKSMIKILLILLILEYVYWFNPIQYLINIAKSFADPDRMMVYLAMPASVLCGFGLYLMTNAIQNIHGFEIGNRIIRNVVVKFSVKGWIYKKHLTIGGLLILPLVVGSYAYQTNWGYSKSYWTFVYNGHMTEDGIKMILWVDQNLPMNATILMDTVTVYPHPSDQEIMEIFGVPGYVGRRGPIEKVADGWIAFADLYPRIVYGNASFFYTFQNILRVCQEKNVSYIIVTRPNELPSSTRMNMLSAFELIHVEGNASLFKFPKLLSFVRSGPSVMVAADSQIISKETVYNISHPSTYSLTLTGYTSYNVSDFPIHWSYENVTINNEIRPPSSLDANSYILISNVSTKDEITMTWKATLLFGEVGWKDDSFRTGWMGNAIFSTDGDIVTISYKNNDTNVAWPTFSRTFVPVNTTADGYRYLIIRLFIEEQASDDYILIYLRDQTEGKKPISVYEKLPRGQWTTLVTDCQQGFGQNKVNHVDAIEIFLRTAGGATSTIKIDYIMLARNPSLI